MAAVTFEKVTKIYPDKTLAVNGVDLEVPDGSLAVLLGPSGCGKTTLLRMVAGLEEITAGVIRIGGGVVNKLSPKQRDIAMVFQNYALYPHMSVYDNMAFGLKVQRVDKRELDRRVRSAAAILGLEDKLRNKPKNLSGGQRQRVAMGRAIVREPRVFLMDEPLSNLDAKLRVQMRAEIARVQRALGTTMLYVTHDQTEAMTLGDVVAVMHDGVVEQVGKPQELYRRPANLFVAGFVGAPAMNLTVATVRRDGDGLAVEFADARLRVDARLLEERPGLRRYLDRRIMLGIRPEHMEDATLVREAPRDMVLSARVDLREEMGAETYVHLSLAGQPAPAVAALQDASAEEDRIPLAGGDATRLEFVARMDVNTGAEERSLMDVFVDTAKLHAFDLDTGVAIYADAEPAPAHITVTSFPVASGVETA